jgi:guanylate kinase
MNEYDYRIVNDQVSDVVCRIEAIMTAERLKVSRYEERSKE